MLLSVMELHQTESFFSYMLGLLEKSTKMTLFIEQSTFLLHKDLFTSSQMPPTCSKQQGYCLFNSGIGKHTRLMWNGQDMLWSHIAALYYADLEQDLHQLPKLTIDHINLTSFNES